MMKFVLSVFLLITIACRSQALEKTAADQRILSNVKIYSNLAEIIQPVGKLPLEFSEDDWRDIRADSVTLVGSDVNITQQTITAKKPSLNNARVYVRSPSAPSTETKFVKATLVDEKRNLVKLIDKDISKDPIFFTVPSDRILYDRALPESKYYVDFTYDAAEKVSVSYLRSNLNWKTRYQLNLFDESKAAVLISMADIRNDGQSRVDIQTGELLGGDINLQAYRSAQVQSSAPRAQMELAGAYAGDAVLAKSAAPVIAQGTELSGLYVFTIDTPFSIDARTNYLLPMFRPQATVKRYGSISKYFHNSGSVNGKAQRSYRLSADQYLSRGSCLIREHDRLVGETSLPPLAASNKHEFSIGEDVDITYKENITLISSENFGTTVRSYGSIVSRTRSTYEVNLLLKNYKARPVNIEYSQQTYGISVELLDKSTDFTRDSLTIKHSSTLPANEEKLFTYKLEIIN